MQQTSRFRLVALFTLLCTLITPVAHAQTAVDGAVGGTVVDASGAIVSGATITVIANATSVKDKLSIGPRWHGTFA